MDHGKFAENSSGQKDFQSTRLRLERGRFRISSAVLTGSCHVIGRGVRSHIRFDLQHVSFPAKILSKKFPAKNRYLNFEIDGGRFNQNTNVDTFPFRQAIWQYVQRVQGIFHDDYDYQQVRTTHLQRCRRRSNLKIGQHIFGQKHKEFCEKIGVLHRRNYEIRLPQF